MDPQARREAQQPTEMPSTRPSGRADRIPAGAGPPGAGPQAVVDTAAAREALKALRGGRSLEASPLAALDIVALRLRSAGIGRSPESVAWAIGSVIDDVVKAGLAEARRGAVPPGIRPETGDGIDAALGADLTSGTPEREAWSALVLRFLAPDAPSVARIVRATGVPRRTLSRRALLGYRLLAERLCALEAEARGGDMGPTDGPESGGLTELLSGLAPGESLPPRPASGWEVRADRLASGMIERPAAFVRDLGRVDLVLAGRLALEPAVAALVPPPVVDALRAALAAATRDGRRELRDRIAAAEVLGQLGDPRFASRRGPHGEYLAPDMVALPAASYPIGSDDAGPAESAPRHRVRLDPFAIGRFPVTRAEWACFVRAGGYDDPRWWETPDAEAWRRGVGTASGMRAYVRAWTASLAGDPGQIQTYLARGELSPEQAARWQVRVRMSAKDLEAHLAATYPDERHVHPRAWPVPDPSPLCPVEGISWYEARAYAAWLAAQTGLAYRLPTEVEWEAAAAGREGRPYPCGDEVPLEGGNTLELHIRAATPVGVFPRGDTPEGVADLVGNVRVWTSSAWGREPDAPAEHAYPYRADDGREDPRADTCRVVRGSGAIEDRAASRCAARTVAEYPSIRLQFVGLRLACGGALTPPR